MMNGLRRKKIPSSLLIFVSLKTMSYSMLMLLELYHPKTKRLKHHPTIWFIQHNKLASTSGDKVKGKELNLSQVYEDEDLDEIGRLDSGNFPNIGALDEDDDDSGEEDLS